jgi:plastocyanin
MKTKSFLFTIGILLALACSFSCSPSYDDINELGEVRRPSSNSGGGDSNSSGDGTSSSSGGGKSSSGGGGDIAINPTITIKNNTGYTIGYSGGVWIKPSTEAQSWGTNLAGYTSNYISNEASRTFTLSQSLSSNNKYDFRLNPSSGEFSFRRYGVIITNGMTLTFTQNDLNDGSTQPGIVLQNRSGKTFNSVHIKPSVSSDWGTSFGSISNNNNLSSTILIPPTNYTVFDIQMRSTEPVNTYTRYDVTISDGMTLTFTSADADNPTIEFPVIVIQNNTGYDIGYSGGVWIKPSTEESWGTSLAGYTSNYISAGVSRTFTLSQHLSVNDVYDIRLKTSSGSFTFEKKNLTVSEGMILTFTIDDLAE